jgi:pSer/pThr/pTyr-binding forkhead associated (FHA) protein
MPYIQLNDTRHPLRVGAMRVGAAADAELRLPGAADPAAAAVVEVGADQSASIRRAHDAAIVVVNGVRLGVNPAPLLHGDKIELGGHELLFGDDMKGGSTQYVPSLMARGAGATPGTVANNGAGPRAGAATAATGGLLRSLVDGREYPVGTAGLVIGRDAGCNVVIPSTEVSRRHAAIMATDTGYELRDTSTNGVWVNGARIDGTATLGRGDVLRIGGEEFRFYADTAAAPAAVSA